MSVRLVDLHMHSPVSDGFWTTENLPPAARELGLHDPLTDEDVETRQRVGSGPGHVDHSALR